MLHRGEGKTNVQVPIKHGIELEMDKPISILKTIIYTKHINHLALHLSLMS